MKISLHALLITVVSCLWFNAYAQNYDAVIELSPRIELSLPVSGVIDKVTVSAGQRVVTGKEMISLDARPFHAAKTYAQSRKTFYQAQLTQSQRDLQHQQELFDRTVLSMVELENAQLRAKRDSALVESANALLARADYELSFSQLKSPFDALIIAVHVNEGQAINNALQSKTLVSLVRPGHFVASFYVPQEMLEKLKIDLPVTVTIKNNQYPAKISEIFYQPVQSNAGSFSESKKQYKVKAEFLVKSDSMLVGQNASVLID